MKKTLVRSISAILWAILLLAIYGAAAQAQSKATGNPSATKTDGGPQLSSSLTATTGTTGQLTKWVSPTTLGDSAVTEDKSGRLGVGTTAPTSKLTVAGVIESTTGGVKFPDGSVQTTAVSQTSNPPLQPFAKVLSGNVLNGSTFVEVMFTVPSGKQFVIETVSLKASMPFGQVFDFKVTSTIGGQVVEYGLFPNKTTSIASTLLDAYGITQPLKIYADPDTQIIATLSRSQALATGTFNLVISGYLVDAQ